MAREFAREFYHSKQWKSTRDAYAASRHYLCERCFERGFFEKGEIVHHKVHLDPSNISDPSVSLSFDNLELLCRKCHADEHPEIYRREDVPRRYRFDAHGNVIRP